MPALVICHTILNDAFRTYPTPAEHQESARFLIRYLIEKVSQDTIQTKFPVCAVTSEQVMGCVAEKLPRQGYPYYKAPAQVLLALRNLITALDTSVKNLNESVIILADVLSTRADTILVTNMLKKVIHTCDFYQKYERSSKIWKEKDIPFFINNTTEIEEILRKKDKEICDKVDSYSKK